MVSAEDLRDQERQELLALYQVTTQDLAFFKSQQWTLTNYTLVAFAAIVGSLHIDSSLTIGPCGRLVLCLIATLIGVIAAWVLWRLKRAIDERRDRLKRIFARFSLTFRDARGEKTQVGSNEMLAFLCVLLGIGLGFVWWLVFVA